MAKICENYGQRVQRSVFECLVYPAAWKKMKRELTETIDPETDNLRFYYLGKNGPRRVESIGGKTVFDQGNIFMF